MSPTQTTVYCYTCQTHPLSIWSHGYQSDTPLLQSTNTRTSKHKPVILATDIIESHIPDFLTVPSSLQKKEGEQISAHQDLQSHEGAASSMIPKNQNLCSDSPSQDIKIDHLWLLRTISLPSLHLTMTNYFPYLTILPISADPFKISAFINLSMFASSKYRPGSVPNAPYGLWLSHRSILSLHR